MSMPRPHAVLIVEDEGLISIMLEDLVREMGARAIDVFSSAAEALAALAHRTYDCAILDVVVRDGTSMPVADALAERGIPFLFSSGVGPEELDPRHRDKRLIAKPFEDGLVKSHLMEILGPGHPGCAPA